MKNTYIIFVKYNSTWVTEYHIVLLYESGFAGNACESATWTLECAVCLPEFYKLT